MAAINPENNPNVFKIEEIQNKQQGSINEANPLGIKKTSGGKETSRINIGIFYFNEEFANVAIKNSSDELSWYEKPFKNRNWVPLKIQYDEEGQQGKETKIKTVLVNINSLSERLGISKTVARKLAQEDPSGEGLARVLNQLSTVSQSLIAQYPAKKKEELIYTALKVCNYIEKHKDKIATQLKGKDSITFSAKNIPTELTKLKSSEKAQNLVFEKVSIFKDGKVLIHLHEIGSGGLKVVNAGIDFIHGKVAIAAPKSVKPAALEDSLREKEVLLHFAEKQKVDPKYKGLIRTYYVTELDVEQAGQVQKMPGFIHPQYNGDLDKFLSKNQEAAPPAGPGVANKPLLSKEELDLALDRSSEGLLHLHEDGFVHRDIKPGNMLYNVDEAGQLSDFVISDLGSCLLDRELDNSSIKSSVGTTIAYCAPEIVKTPHHMLNHDMWKNNDLWQLGCVFYKLITGENAPWVQDFNNKYKEVYEAKFKEEKEKLEKEGGGSFDVKFINEEATKRAKEEAEKSAVKFFNEKMQDASTVSSYYDKIKAKAENLDPKHKALIIGMLNPDPTRRLDITKVRAVLAGNEEETKNAIESASFSKLRVAIQPFEEGEVPADFLPPEAMPDIVTEGAEAQKRVIPSGSNDKFQTPKNTSTPETPPPLY